MPDIGDFIRRSRRSAKIAIAAPGTPGDFRRWRRSAYKVAKCVAGFKSPLNTKEAIQIVKAACRRLIRARINDCNRRLNYYSNKLRQRLNKLKQLIPTNLVLDTVLTVADKRATQNGRTKPQQKLTRLLFCGIL